MRTKTPARALLLGLLCLGVLAAACGGTTGSRGWAPPVRPESGSLSSLLLVSSGKGRIDALNPSTRTPQWRFPNRWSFHDRGAGSLQGIYGAPMIGNDGTIYLGDYNGRVYAFNTDKLNDPSGEKPKAGAFELDDAIVGGVALDQASGLLFVTSGAKLYKLQSSQLKERINNKDAPIDLSLLVETQGDIWSAPLLANGKAYVSSQDGKLYAVDQQTGRLDWTFDGQRALASTPVLSGDKLLVGGFNRRLYAVNASSGSQAWEFQAPNWVWSRPLVDSNRVYFGDFDGNLFALNLSDGSQIWRLDLKRGTIRSAPVLTNGVLIVGTEDGWLIGVDPSNQSIRWQREVGTSITADLVVQGSNVYIAPSKCVTPEGASEEKVYYIMVDSQSGELTAAQGIC
jgi:outer membrane protein assembly factor BamB